MKLPKPKSKLGYSREEVLAICRDRDIKPETFWEAFGINTVGVEIVDGKRESRLYACDVERALHILGKGGKDHQWD